MVLDRLFLWIFTAACVGGTCGIFLQAPTIYDTTQPIDIVFSKVAREQMKALGHDMGMVDEDLSEIIDMQSRIM